MGFVIFTVMVGSLAFGATYVYSNPALQKQLGIKALIDGLPWKHQELVDKAREHPLEFQRMTLQLSTREGKSGVPAQGQVPGYRTRQQPLSGVGGQLQERTGGLEGRSEKVEAQFFDPNGLQIASSDAQPVRRSRGEDTPISAASR